MFLKLFAIYLFLRVALLFNQLSFYFNAMTHEHDGQSKMWSKGKKTKKIIFKILAKQCKLNIFI